MTTDDATRRQMEASRPNRSTWLSANAGSGKTKVLTDRVARLLLDGVDPQNVLCLTYTKAAASEMQNRLFQRLGAWAMLPNDTLEKAILSLDQTIAITPDTLRQARRLFARAIETPGGLKIQTIHSFCSALLRKFPFEAGVTPNFSEMEDRAALLLQAEIIETLAAGPERPLVEAVAPFARESLSHLTQGIVGRRTEFAKGLNEPALRRLLGVPEGFDDEALLNSVFLGGELELLSQLAKGLEASSPHDVKASLKLKALKGRSIETLGILEGVLLHGKGAKRDAPFTARIGKFPTKAGQKLVPNLLDQLNALMLRVEDARIRRLGLITLNHSIALHAFADGFLSAYERAKMLRGWLDFDDLIQRARDLLLDPKVADWVLYRLDGRIDHILVDEAQDTSPTQWQVIECLAREFTSGEGTKSGTTRTIFVVGDKKQSIYSFQGADPREFDRMREDFRNRLSTTKAPLQDLRMEVSFRSAPAVLSLVDNVFDRQSKSGFGPDQRHISFKSELPGRVDLWHPIEKPDDPEDPPWYDPVDVKSPDDPNSLLAENIAGFIECTIGTPLPGQPGEPVKSVTAGDFLILVRKRQDLFHAIIRACKNRGLAVAGADRLKIGGELAVRDLQALLSVLVTQEDDLSLATALRSPLFGWSEGALFDLAHGRKEMYLFAELRKRADEFPETMSILDDLRDQVDFLRPYDLIERILTRHDGRRKLLGRLGMEAEDGIDALLSQALAYERQAVDSLTGFLVWMETDDLEIKRQLDTAGDRIRVMTVHGAKGLESPIVILPDTAQWRSRAPGDMTLTEAGVIWRASKEETTLIQHEHDEMAELSEAAERDRLLYVGMTRAEQWLVVAAAGNLGKSTESWHDKIRRGMEGQGAMPTTWPWADGLRVENGDWARSTTGEIAPEVTAPASVPFYMTLAAPEPPERGGTLSPSTLGGAKALPDERGLDEEAAKRRGRQIHRLLEVLPEVETDQWTEVSQRLLSTEPDKAGAEECALLLAEARKIIEKPSLAEIFAAGALTEVPISAKVDLLGGQRIHGVIDRLILSDSDVLAIDFKTNAMVPQRPTECPDGLLRQMGAYGDALATLYPDRKVQTAFLWTRTATLMHLPHDLVTEALRNTYIP